MAKIAKKLSIKTFVVVPDTLRDQLPASCVTNYEKKLVGVETGIFNSEMLKGFQQESREGAVCRDFFAPNS